MMQKNKSSISQRDIPLYLWLLTFFFILLEISFFIQCNKAYLSDFTYVSDQLRIPVSILPGILFFVGAQLFIHLSYCLLVWFSAVFCGYLLKFNTQQKFNFAIILWVIGIVAAFASNQNFFPYSKFSELSSLLFITPSAAKASMILFTSIFLLTVLAGIAGFIMWLIHDSFRYILLLLLLFSALFWFMLAHIMPVPAQVTSQTQPNVFIIGIDSLRPDFLGFFGADDPTPFLDNMLAESTVFNEAVTPLARTFPSWISILTGKHPQLSGIRSNLVNIDNINFSNSLPAIFKQHGYETIFATDETRFSNIDTRIGFDKIISPPIGLNDFLLGSFNDFPLSNLLVNTALGRLLFPYSYANRPAFHTYDPDSFIALMQPFLQKKREQPLLMAVHFCLPHAPYLWANAKMNHQHPVARYQASIIRVDQQIKSFFALLNNAHLLDHAIVVLLSDHGEALELSGDRITEQASYLGKRNQAGQPPRFYPPSLDDEAINQSAGHGTDVLGWPQYHTLLAFKLFGMGQQEVGEISGVVPLSDIKQTLLSLAGIMPSSNREAPLAAIVHGHAQHAPRQHVFIESDFSPESIHTVYPETRQVMLEGVQLYEINPLTTRLTIKPEMSHMIIRSKQYADIFDGWMLAFYPQNNRYHMPILINLKTGQWTNDMQSNFARLSPAMVMQKQLKSFYGGELNNAKN